MNSRFKYFHECAVSMHMLWPRIKQFHIYGSFTLENKQNEILFRIIHQNRNKETQFRHMHAHTATVLQVTKKEEEEEENWLPALFRYCARISQPVEFKIMKPSEVRTGIYLYTFIHEYTHAHKRPITIIHRASTNLLTMKLSV